MEWRLITLTLKKRGSEFSSWRAFVPSGHVGAMKHLIDVPMSTTAFRASEDALNPYTKGTITSWVRQCS